MSRRERLRTNFGSALSVGVLAGACVWSALGLLRADEQAVAWQVEDCSQAAQVSYQGRKRTLCGAEELANAGLADGEQRHDDGSLARMAPRAIKALGLAVDINRASALELATLPGIGPKLAQRVIDERPFEAVEQLERVKGIGPKKLAALRLRARVGSEAGRG